MHGEDFLVSHFSVAGGYEDTANFSWRDFGRLLPVLTLHIRDELFLVSYRNLVPYISLPP